MRRVDDASQRNVISLRSDIAKGHRVHIMVRAHVDTESAVFSYPVSGHSVANTEAATECDESFILVQETDPSNDVAAGFECRWVQLASAASCEAGHFFLAVDGNQEGE